jgi:hypothetical protein
MTGFSPWSRNSFWQKAREEPPIVELAVEIDDESAFKLCFAEDHYPPPVLRDGMRLNRHRAP